jgi:glycosyltransferase involved in cell wall biosynthesis
MINVISEIFGSSGYASHARSLVNELNKLTKCKILTNLPQGFERDVNDQELEMIKRQRDFDINLIITHPLHWKANCNAKRNFVYLIWEGDRVPEWIYRECNNPNIEKIICPSKHTYDAVMNTDSTFPVDVPFKDKVVKIPHGVDLETFFPKETKVVPNVTSSRFKFLMNKGFRNMEDRGGVQYGIKAYLEEFKKEDNVELIVKINPAYGIPDVTKMFQMEQDSPKITFITENYTKKQLNELYNECDVFVSPTRAEAFNLPCLEAMACGKPVIATNYGGQIDFIDIECGWLIDYELVEVQHELEFENCRWGVPKHDHLKSLLRSAYISRDGIAEQKNNKIVFYKSPKELGDKALQVAKKYTWENTAKHLNTLIN